MHKLIVAEHDYEKQRGSEKSEREREKYPLLLYVFLSSDYLFSFDVRLDEENMFFLHSSDRLSPQIVVSHHIFPLSFTFHSLSILDYEIFSLKWDNH